VLLSVARLSVVPEIGNFGSDEAVNERRAVIAAVESRTGCRLKRPCAGTDFSDAAIEAVKLIGANLQIQPMSKLDEMKFNGSLKEICNDKKNQ
jgi:hypothetical protein